MKRVFEFIKWVFYITTSVLIVVAVNIQISGDDIISADTLWKILASGFLTALVTVLMRPDEQNNWRSGVVKMVIHYVALCVVMIVLGYWFGWLELDFPGVVMMVISVAFVYLLVFMAAYWLDKKQADEINQRLQGKYSDKE